MNKDKINIVIGSCVGVFVGYSIYNVYHYKNYYSAPWYTGILLYGAVLLIEIIICLIIKRKLK